MSININDETSISKSEKAQIELVNSIICKIIEIREEKGLTQQELAKLCGVNQTTLEKFESMTSIPPIDTILKILNPLGYTLSIVPINE